jgi:hypothetical protein
MTGLDPFGETKTTVSRDTFTVKTMETLYNNVTGSIGNGEKRLVYLVRGEDLLIGSFAYSSSLLEQQL